mmetsp:Transcript_17339/g.24081  ORF Transcript_17339/g.24081 Transcript_17339/m.24081 type:complete len:653 (+) Transcript_17339:167-2125(+)
MSQTEKKNPWLRRIDAVARHLTGDLSSENNNTRAHAKETCGIVGYVGKEPAFGFLMEGLEILENRGYDSAGITTIDDHQLRTTKFASSRSTSDSIPRLSKSIDNHRDHHIGIAHTRWATHGGKTDTNAHPHHDSGNLVSIVHNGIIDNADILREQLQNEGVVFRSQTDSEVIAQLLGKSVAAGTPLKEAFAEMVEIIQGTWGIVAVSVKEPEEIVATTRGSPLLIGIGTGCMFVASEASAFSKYTNEFVVLRDDEIAVIQSDGHSMEEVFIERVEKEVFASSPDPWPHWTIKEIMEQPQSLSRSLGYGGRFSGADEVKLGGLDSRRAQLLNIKHLLIVGCGTSLYAGMVGAKIMRDVSSFETIRTVDASELTRADFPKQNGGILVLSQSGETKDCHRALVLASQEDIFSFSIVNSVRSLIARTTNCGLYVHAGRENGVASTKSFTSQVVCLALVALWFAQQNTTKELTKGKRLKLVEDLQRLPTICGMVLKQVHEPCRQVAHLLRDTQHAFILGRGMAEAVAYEGSLKIKEITYTHCEGFAGGALKHGPFALIETGTVIFVILMDDEHLKFMKTVAHEVRARGATIIGITNSPAILSDKDLQLDHVLFVRHDGTLTPVLAVLPLQLIAYELAILRDLNPDRPRNLAKCVTVD